MNQVYREIEQHIPDLRRYAGSIVRSPMAADDLVQESLLKALDKSHLYKPDTNLRAWLFTILRNQHVSELRRQGRAGATVDPDDAAPALATKPNQENRIAVTTVSQALNAMPEEQRIPIELVALHGESYAEVAKTLGVALGTVKSRISRARQELRKALHGHSVH